MRLGSVYIRQYKNFKKFDLSFDSTGVIDVFAGKNGSDKSNFFEALIEIFRAMLLPVPTDDVRKKQVLNADGKPWGKGSESHLPIELLFYSEERLGKGFEKRATSGGGEIIEFTGDKVKFAKDVVPTLDVACFEILRPMFELIKSKCN